MIVDKRKVETSVGPDKAGVIRGLTGSLNVTKTDSFIAFLSEFVYRNI